MGEEQTALQGLNTLEDDGRTGEGGTSSKTVEVRGFSMDTSHDLLEMYFENSRRSGGGDIEEFEIKNDVAYITFEEPEVVQRVVSKSPHQVAGQRLTVRQFCPPLQKPCYENRVLVQIAVNEELLTNFLEKETGMKVMEFLYGEEGRKVVVTFSNHIDFAAIRKACYTTKIEGFFLRVAKVVISSCIFVKNLPPLAPHDVILLYFENRRRSGGGEVERVEMNTAERYCLVYFVDHDVIDRVLSQQHKIDGADIEVHLHHECLGRRSSRSRYDPFLRIYKPEMKENLLKAETSSSVSSSPDKGCDYVETPKWQEDDGKNCVLPLWIKYKRASERMIIKIMKELPCSWNFHVFWNFFTKTKQGQHMLDDILKKCGCSVTVPGDDDLFIFEISDAKFEEESDMMDFITGALGAVYACAQQSLFFDILLVDHRMLEDVLQTIKQRKEMDSAWIELVGEQEPDAVCVVCTEKDKASILKVVTTIKAAVQDCFENYWNVALIDPMWYKVLKKFGYLQEMSEKFPNLTMTPDEAKGKIMLKGPRDQSSGAAKHLMELLATAHAEVQEDIFFPGCQFDIFAYPEMCDYIDNSVIKLPFVWIPNHQTKKMHLFSKKLEQEMVIDKFIKAFIKEKIYPLTKDQSLCNPTIAGSLEELMKKHKGKIVINYSPTGLILTTADDIFESVDSVVQEIIGFKTGCVDSACVTETHAKRPGQLVDQSEYKTSENQRKTEDSLPAKRDDTSEQKTKNPEDVKSVPNVNFDQLEVMIKHENKVKSYSDGIDMIQPEIKVKPSSDDIGMIQREIKVKPSSDDIGMIQREIKVKPSSDDIGMSQPEIKVKPCSDGIGISKPEKRTKPNLDGIGKIEDRKKSTCKQSTVGLVPVGDENIASQASDQDGYPINIDAPWQVALDKFGYLRDICEMFPAVTLVLYTTTDMCVIKGPQQDIKIVVDHLTDLLLTAQHDIVETRFCPCNQFEIMTCPEMQQYIERKIAFEMNQTSYAWVQNFKTNEVHVFAENKVNCERVEMFIKSCIREEDIILPAHIDYEQKIKLIEKSFSSHKGKIWIKHDNSHIVCLTTANDIFDSIKDELQVNLTKYITSENSSEENMVNRSLTDPSQVSKDGTAAIVGEGAFEKILPIENRSVYRCMIKVVRWIKKTGLEHTVEVRELNEPLRVGFVLQGPSDRVLEMTDYIKKVQEGIITQNYLTFSASEVSYLGSAEGQQIIARLEEENSCNIQIIDPAKVSCVEEEDRPCGGSIGLCRMVTFIYPHNHTVSLINGMVENCKTDVIVMLVLTPSTPRGQRKSKFIVAQSRTRLYIPLSSERNSDAETLLFENICAALHYFEDKNFVKVGFAINPVGNWHMGKFVKVFLCAVNDFFSQSQETSGWKVYLCTTDEDEFERMKNSAFDFLQPLMTAQNRAEDAYMVKIDATLSKAVLPSNPVLHFDMIELRVEVGDLSQFEADVIVNTTSLNLDLNNGATSKSLLRAAGQKIQDECKKAYPKGIHEGEVARTSGGNMKCKQIFHGALKRYSNSDMDWSKKLEIFIDACLTLASQLEYKSIAFPALGTGTLGLPRDHVAHVMFNCVKEFSSRKLISVEKVFFVIYHKDEVTLQVFQDTIQKFKTPEKGNTESSCLEIQVTGLEDRVYEVITSIQKEFKCDPAIEPYHVISKSRYMQPGLLFEEKDACTKIGWPGRWEWSVYN